MSVAEEKHSAKGHRLLWIGVGIAVVIVLVPVLVLGWLGFVPGVSSMMGADQPKDLGVQYTPADVTAYQSKSGIKFEDVAAAPADPKKPAKKQVFADPKPIETSFTQEELSAAVNSASVAWLPLKDVQIKLGDHTAEVSGLLNTQRIPEFLKMASGLGLKESDLARISGYADKLAEDIPVYVKAAGAVENSELNLEIQEFSVGRFAVSADAIAKAMPDGIHKTIKSSDTFSIQTATPRDGSLAFSGILPTTIYLKKD